MKRILLLLLLITFVLCNTSCKTTDCQIDIDKDSVVSVDTKYLTYLSSQHQISIQIPYFKSEKLNQLFETYITEYLQNVCDIDVALSLTMEDVNINPTSDYSEYYINLDCESIYEFDNIISVSFEGVINHKTGAHPTNCFFSLNVNPITEERIWFKDLYSVNDKLYKVFRKYACETLRQKADAKWFDNLDFSALCSEDRFIQGLEEEKGVYAFFTRTGLGICYPVAHTMGDYQKVEIPYSDINRFLND